MGEYAPRFAAGSRVAGYLLDEQIGQGGMAVVFRAHDERLDRTVALKILAPGLASDEAFRQRFIRESRAAAAVDDPHIIPVFEAGEASGVLFIAMRYVRGGDVGTLLRGGPLPPAEAAGIVSQVASALDAAHARGLVHRDVKPTNMLLDAGDAAGRPDHVYLSDFGLSKGQLTAAKITATGQFLGTLDYMSPEQVGSPHVGPRSDQYSLACAAFELLAGVPPFERETGMAVMFAHAHEPPPPLTGRRPDLPAEADAVFARALAKAPGDRYASCGEFAEALREALGLQPYRSGPRERLAQAPASESAIPAPAASPVPALTEVATDPGEAAASQPPAHGSLTEVSEPVAVAGLITEADRQPQTAAVAASRAWWRSRLAIVVAAAIVVAGGGGAALLLSGGNGPRPAGTLIFKSDFSSAADGWQVPGHPADGRLSSGTYYVSDMTSNGGATGVPTGASSVYPSAPANIRIDVSARWVSGPQQAVQYGLVCRDNSNGAYLFQIQGGQATIAKDVGGTYSALRSISSGAINSGGANELSATCATVAGQQAVQLTLTVNGTQLLAVTDRANPITGGTVGVFANFYHSSIPNGVKAAFQSFEVRQLLFGELMTRIGARFGRAEPATGSGTVRSAHATGPDG
jgi:serine/threonine protein kinase